MLFYTCVGLNRNNENVSKIKTMDTKYALLIAFFITFVYVVFSQTLNFTRFGAVRVYTTLDSAVTCLN